MLKTKFIPNSLFQLVLSTLQAGNLMRDYGPKLERIKIELIWELNQTHSVHDHLNHFRPKIWVLKTSPLVHTPISIANHNNDHQQICIL